MAGAPKEIWLRTDEIEEFIGALEFSAELGAQVAQDITKWKWLTLALHNALQGACVCALRAGDTAGLAVLTKKSRAELWHWLDIESRSNPQAPMPEERLAEMLELYRSCKKVKFLARPLPEDLERDRNVKRLNDIRNEFSHFVPQGLSLEVSGMPRIVRNCCSAITHLAVDHPTFSHHLRDPQRQRINHALERLTQAMRDWEEACASA